MAGVQDMFRVMSYNIKCDCNQSNCGDNCWEKRKDLVASVVRFHHAGIIGMQEVKKNQLDYLLDDEHGALTEFDYIGEPRDESNDAEFCPILYLRNCFTVEDQGQFWLSESGEKGSKGWGATIPRIVTWAKFADQATGKKFYHFNTHFEHNEPGKQARDESASLVLKKSEEFAKETAVILTGDFNCRAVDRPYKILVGEEYLRSEIYPPLIDAQFANQKNAQFDATFKHHGPSTTYLKEFSTARPENKIDFIFIKNKVKVVNHGVLDAYFERENGTERRYSSDHLPIVADLTIE